MSDQTILVVDDDLKIRNLLRNVLEDDGFTVREAKNCSEALQALNGAQIDLITLDIHLGSKNGIDLARQIRQDSLVPIIMVTGKDDVIDRVVGLEVGADDYITKPFHVREVVARIRSVLRRTAQSMPVPQGRNEAPVQANDVASARFCFDSMTAIPDRMELLDRDGSECGLTSGDFKLLAVFLNKPKRVLSRDQLMDLTGGIGWSPLDRAIDNQVARLRKKIERDPSKPKLIKTVRGVGYTFACDVQIVPASGSSAKSA